MASDDEGSKGTEDKSRNGAQRDDKDENGEKKNKGDKGSKDENDEKGDKGEGEKGEGEKGEGEKQPEKPHSKKPLIIIAAVVVVAAIVGFFIWFAHRNQVSTDDAFTDGNVVTMAPKVTGYVTTLLIDDNMHVRQGDLLLKIDPRDYLTAKAQAEAGLALAKAQQRAARDSLKIARVQYPAQLSAARAQQQAAEATLEQAKREYSRQHEVDRRATTQQSVDASTNQQTGSQANLKSAKAQVAIASLVPEQIQLAMTEVQERAADVAQAEAQLAQANLNLNYTEIRAPSDGFITLRSVQLGDFVSAGTTLFMIVTPEVWVTANFKESQLGRMRPGDSAEMKIDAYSGYTLYGHVQSIQYGSGSKFSAFPAENATGNFVKIVQRVPVKIVIDRGLDPNRPLPLGLSVSPVVHFP